MYTQFKVSTFPLFTALLPFHWPYMVLKVAHHAKVALSAAFMIARVLEQGGHSCNVRVC